MATKNNELNSLMKQYYIFINEERKGPLSFEELKQENISKETLVWYEGLTEWKKANEVEELKELFKVIPPPINPVSQIPPPPIIEKKSIPEYELEQSTILGLNKKLFYVIAIIVIIGTIGFYNYQANESQRIEQINNRIAEQEQIEKQRRLVEIQNLLHQNQQKLEEAQSHLNDVTGFKLLRTSSERNEQINAAQNNINAIKENIRKIKQEMKNLNN